MNPEPKTPLPFLPLWTAKAGPMIEHGSGLLTRSLYKQKDVLDWFEVFTGTYRVKIEPRLGKIKLDSHIAVNLGKASTLLWFRRMEKQIYTFDKTNAPAECRWYGLGLENGNNLLGFRIYESGSIKEGLHA